MAHLRIGRTIAIGFASAALACGANDDEGPRPTDPIPDEGNGPNSIPPDDYGGGGHGDTTPAHPPDLTHTFPPLTLDPGQELGTGRDDAVCQVWRMRNPEPVWVNTIVAKNEGGFHHSNWFIYEESFTEAEGTWQGCPITTGLGVGNIGMFFAMSTQADGDVQAFEPGAAFQVPANAVVIGNLHLLNTSTAPLDTSMTFEVHTVAPEEVTKPLLATSYAIGGIAVPPGQSSEAKIDCVWEEPGVEAHYLLSHYHQWGTSMTVESGGQIVFEGHGEPSGMRLDPPVVIGNNLSMKCTYDNPDPRTIYWENSGNGEMCMFLMFTTGRNHFGGDALPNCTASGNAIQAIDLSGI